MRYLELQREGNSLLKALPFPMGKTGGFRPVPKFGKGGTKCRKGGYQMQKRGVPNAEKGGTKCRMLKFWQPTLTPVAERIIAPQKQGEKCSILFIDFIVYILREKTKGLKPHFFPLWGFDFASKERVILSPSLSSFGYLCGGETSLTI